MNKVIRALKNDDPSAITMDAITKRSAMPLYWASVCTVSKEAHMLAHTNTHRPTAGKAKNVRSLRESEHDYVTKDKYFHIMINICLTDSLFYQRSLL